MKITLFIIICICLSACQLRSTENSTSSDTLSSSIELTTKSEPGESLILLGKVTDPVTGIGVKNIKIFVYHTNKEGIYNENGSSDPRINGYVITDASGNFKIYTIIPGSYPNSQNPRHVHFVIEANGKEQFAELVFEGDPYVTDRLKTIPEFIISPLIEKSDCKEVQFEIKLK